MRDGKPKLAMTAKAAADLMGVHVNTVRAMIEDGRLKGYKTGNESGHWRITYKELDAFMNKKNGEGSEESVASILSKAHYLLDEVPNELVSDSLNSHSLWEFVNRYYGIRSVFGSIAIHSDMDTYRSIIGKKGMVWIGEGTANFMDASEKAKGSSKFSRDKLMTTSVHYAFGVVKAPSIFDEYVYSLVPLLVVEDGQENEWTVDGTLQQFFPEMEKGLVVLPLEQAETLYLNLQVFDKHEFAERYSDPTTSNRFIAEAKRLEKEAADEKA